MAGANQQTVKKAIIRVAVITLAVNIVLTCFKLFAGLYDHSKGIVSDAVHSASDVFTTLIVIVGVIISSKKADKGHRYGHERLECVASIILAVVLFTVGAGIGYDGITSIANGSYKGIEPPKLLALLAAVVSIVCKEGMFWYTMHYARRYQSLSLKADAWHHRSDAFSSVGSMIGVIGAMLGAPICDVIASLAICLLILKVAVDVFREAINKMVDKACDDDTVNAMKSIIMGQDGVLHIDDLKTRMFGSKIYVDIEICVDRRHSVESAHTIAQAVHDQMEAAFASIKHCTVHVNPSAKSPLEECVIEAAYMAYLCRDGAGSKEVDSVPDASMDENAPPLPSDAQ